MNQRWGIKNLMMSMSHRQFIALTTEFKQAAEGFFGTPCKLEVRAMTAPKVYSTFMLDDDVQGNLDRANDERTILKTEDLSTITPEVWKSARYVDVVVRPVDEKKAPDYAFGTAEFKGRHSSQATFYIQAGNKRDDEGPRDAVVAKHPYKIITEGWESHSERVFDRAPGMRI